MRRAVVTLAAVVVSLVGLGQSAEAVPMGRRARPISANVERWESRVPVCAEDERALGVGDYRGSESGGWERWSCVHVDQLAEVLGLS